MRRGDRLFQIVQLLRTHKSITARQMSERLEVSERTIYRDMQDLSLSCVPIISETGVGYSIDPAYSLPPITFNEHELESLLLGARMVQAWSDRQMAAQAARVIEKIECILPEGLKQTLQSKEIQVPAFYVLSDVAQLMPDIRQSIKQKNKVTLHYQRADGEKSTRVVWPLGLFFWGKIWTLVAWCEKRDDFRQFRLDRIESCKISAGEFRTDDKQTLEYFLSKVCDGEENKKM
ncbi:Transcriptional regulator, DeoR family [hydrothermal vent metagenome]|uniref:Transcriptional regulator, DeoR family n=1 Tax=hydrothermal vent metagenome TaxID=652676 RepID=A0A3B0XUY2_9ZZZZ